MSRFHEGVHWLVLAIVVVVGGISGWRLLTSAGPPRCDFAVPYLPDASLFIVGIAAYFGGHLLQMSDGGSIPSKTDPRWQRSQRLRRVAMLAIFPTLAAIALFEALGTARLPIDKKPDVTLLPITFYTRCAISHDIQSAAGGLTVLAIIAIFFLAGHWFWGERPRENVAT